MEGKFMRLSKQKFSSNVVEKCLKQSSSHWKNIIIHELIAQPAVGELLRDRYGNFVIQCSLTVASPQQVHEISMAITPYLHTLRENVKAKWQRLLQKASAGHFQAAHALNPASQRFVAEPGSPASSSLSGPPSEPASPIQSFSPHGTLYGSSTNNSFFARPPQHTYSQPTLGPAGLHGAAYSANSLSAQLSTTADLSQSNVIYQNLPRY